MSSMTEQNDFNLSGPQFPSLQNEQKISVSRGYFPHSDNRSSSIYKYTTGRKKNRMSVVAVYFSFLFCIFNFLYRQALSFNRKIIVYKSHLFLFEQTWIVIIPIDFPFPFSLFHTICPSLSLLKGKQMWAVLVSNCCCNK